MTTGGDIKEITFSNDEVGTGIFKPKAKQAGNLKLGGYVNADDGSQAADGELIVKKNLEPGSFDCPVANDMNVRKDLETAQRLANSLSPTTWTVSHVNGCIYKGEGIIVGELVANTDDATFPLKVHVPVWAQI